MAQGASLASMNSLGDLVPVLHPPNGNGHANGAALATLLDNLHSKSKASAYKHWQNLDQQPRWPEYAHGQLSAPAHTCVLQMPDKTVGVLKVAADGGCTLLVRLNRPHASQMADRDEVPRDKARAFRRSLSVTEAFKVLSGAKPYCLKEAEVHHPHALSLLCSMTRRGWLAPGIGSLPLVASSFSLLALTPLPRNVEQCLVLMGWKAAYMPADEALWTAQAVDRSVWGETHDDFFVGDVAPKFADAARDLPKCADPAVFTQHIPQVNENSGPGSDALFAVQKFLGAAKAFSTAVVCATAPVPAPAAAAAADESSEVDMAPSDEEGGALFVVPAAAAAAATAAAAEQEKAPTSSAPPPQPSPQPPGTSSRPRQRSRGQSSSRSRPRKAQRDNDDSDTQDHDEEKVAKQDAELQEVVSTDSESEGNSDDDDDDDDDKDSSESSSDSEGSPESSSDSEPLAQKPIAKNNQHTPTAKNMAAAVPGAQRPNDAQWLVEFARPCCKHIELFQREHQALIAPERMALIDADLQALRKPDSVPALLGAALSLVGNVVGVHRDAPPGEAMPLGAVGRKRVRELAVRATDFSELTLTRVDRAIESARKTIEDLEDLRKRGRTVLESVENACAAGATPPEAAAGAEPPQA